MSDKTFGFSEEIQRKLVSMLLFNEEAFVDNLEIIKPEFFDNPALSDMVRIISNFFRKYNRVPTSDEFLEELDSFIKEDKRKSEEYLEIATNILEIGVLDDSGFDYVRDKAREFARYQAVKRAILESGKVHMKKKNYEAILTEVQDALLVGEGTQDLGLLYYEDLEDRLKRRREGRHDRRDIAIGTGIKSLDYKLRGGILRREMGIIMGPSKRGKSMTAVNFAAGASFQGHNVLHLFFEGGSEDIISDMYDSCISDIPYSELKDREDEVRKAVVEYHGSPVNGRIVLKFFPSNSCSVLTIESYLRKLKTIEKFVPDVLILDYLGLMIPADYSFINKGDRYSAFSQIVKEIMRLSQRHDFATWLLHQSTRSSFKKDIIRMDDSADSMEPMRHADIILTLNQSQEDEEAEPQKFRIHAAGGRHILSNWQITLGINKDRCKIFELEKEA